ncbi:WD domain, G-beta repeat protein [Ancylostoma duodenale]|uniref:WD domain, G-beta repeat protein n=1 Tax=Ancylostoma duodenale TaxID=51022 RepID=A0A0C2DF87_9BILA|nr:WD domain, G-beta repeat protein [Ancylostoma duodenale]
MCPESEVCFRCSNGMVHVLERSRGSREEEDTSKMVKEYARPAAGRDHLHPECLRPPDVLVQTVRYLLRMYEHEKHARFGCVYSFNMDGVVMISDIAWIPRGIAKHVPDKVKLDENQLKELISGGVPDTSDVESDEVEESEPGVRGSASKEPEGNDADVEMQTKEDEGDSAPEAGMRGIAMYSSNTDDPYVTLHVDSDEEEKEEIEIKPEDNMVALAKIDRDNYTLEVFVYNENNGDWYCHHDYILDAPPLCLEPIQHDPGNDETGKGNLLAVGTMEPVINIWDLDIMNAVAPVVSLGAKSKGRRKKRDGREQGHSDAVLSIAWNKLTPHVLASGGADKEIILWDLDEAKTAQSISGRGGEVHLNQTFSVIWNHFNPFTAFVASDDGILRHIDMRTPGNCLWEGRAHDGSVGGLTLSSSIRGLLVTVGHDQMLCVWKAQENGSLLKVHSERQHVGALHAAKFNPDVATVCCIGGSSNDLVKLVDLGKASTVTQAFS